MSENLSFRVVEAHVKFEVRLISKVLTEALILEILTKLFFLLRELQLPELLLSLNLFAKFCEQLHRRILSQQVQEVIVPFE